MSDSMPDSVLIGNGAGNVHCQTGFAEFAVMGTPELLRYYYEFSSKSNYPFLGSSGAFAPLGKVT